MGWKIQGKHVTTLTLPTMMAALPRVKLSPDGSVTPLANLAPLSVGMESELAQSSVMTATRMTTKDARMTVLGK